MQTHKQSLQRKLQERQVELSSKQQQLSSTLQESDALRAVIASQTVNKDDVARMNQEKCALRCLASVLHPKGSAILASIRCIACCHCKSNPRKDDVDSFTDNKAFCWHT